MGIPKSSAPVRPHLFIDELAARRGLNKFTIYHWLSEKPGQLPPAFRLGGRIVFKLKDVEAWEDSVLVPYAPGQKPAVRDLGEPRAHRGRPTKAQQIKRRLEKAGA